MEMTINPVFGLGDKGYGIKQKQVFTNIVCPQCNGQGEVHKNGGTYYCNKCRGAGTVQESCQRWFVDDNPLEIGIIRATISKNQTVYKYKGRIDGSPSNRSSNTLFPTIEEAVAECNKRNSVVKIKS